MRVTFVLPNIDVSGGIKIVLEYANFLAHRRHSVTVIYPTKRASSLKQCLKDLINGKIWTKPAPYSSSFLSYLEIKPVRARRTGILLSADVPEADIVIATWWETAEWVNTFPNQKGLKVYFIQGHEIFEGLPKERVKNTYSMPFRKIVVSTWLAEIMASNYSDRSVRVVKNGVNIERFHNNSRNRTDPFTVGMLYSSNSIKNSEMAINAILEARRALPILRAILFGMGPRPVSIQGLDWFEYHYQPSQGDIPELYRRSHVWLFPSHSEGFGLPLLEAMASGTPVIATRAGAAPDLVDGQNGVLVDWKYQDMAKEILRIAGMEPDAWLQMSRHARTTAEENSWQSAALQFEQELLDVRSRR